MSNLVPISIDSMEAVSFDLVPPENLIALMQGCVTALKKMGRLRHSIKAVKIETKAWNVNSIRVMVSGRTGFESSDTALATSVVGALDDLADRTCEAIYSLMVEHVIAEREGYRKIALELEEVLEEVRKNN